MATRKTTRTTAQNIKTKAAAAMGIIALRVSAEMHKSIRAIAKAKGVTPSELMRDALESAAKRFKK